MEERDGYGMREREREGGKEIEGRREGKRPRERGEGEDGGGQRESQEGGQREKENDRERKTEFRLSRDWAESQLQIFARAKLGTRDLRI